MVVKQRERKSVPGIFLKYLRISLPRDMGKYLQRSDSNDFRRVLRELRGENIRTPWHYRRLARDA